VANPLASTLELGTIRVGYATADFASAVRGLLVQPLLDRGIGAPRVDDIVGAVLRREEAGSTCAGPVALPHARISGIPSIIAGLGVNASGICEGGETSVMLAFVSPAEAAGEHLRFLAMVAKTFRDGAFVQRLLRANNAEEILALFRDGESPSR